MSTFFGAIASSEPRPDDVRKQSLQRQLRAAREDLTAEGGLKTSYRQELMLAYAQNRQASWLLMVGLAVGIALAQGFWWSSAREATVNFVAVLLSQSITLLIANRFQKEQGQDFKIGHWQIIFGFSEAIAGLAWCLMLMSPLKTLMPEAAMFSVFCALLVCAVITIQGASLPNAVASSIVPIVGLLALSLATNGDVISRSLSGMIIAAGGFLVLLAYRFYKVNLENIEHKLEKDRLIGELEQAKAISDEARRKAEEGNIAKSRFLATMSHELRTPLNAILGFSEVLKDEVFGPMNNAAYKDYAKDINSSGQHLLNLINEILDLSRIESGKHELQEEALNLQAVAEDCQYLLKMRADNKNITLKTMFEKDMPKLWADERAVRQMIINLMSNAIKFTPQGGEIVIKVGWTSSGGQYVGIKDNGPGIPEEEIPIVLEQFGRGNNAVKTAEQGTGLGLPIVNALIQRHGGRMDFKSKLRVGTEVTIMFPPSRVMDVLAPMEETSPRRAA